MSIIALHPVAPTQSAPLARSPLLPPLKGLKPSQVVAEALFMVSYPLQQGLFCAEGQSTISRQSVIIAPHFLHPAGPATSGS